MSHHKNRAKSSCLPDAISSEETGGSYRRTWRNSEEKKKNRWGRHYQSRMPWILSCAFIGSFFDFNFFNKVELYIFYANYFKFLTVYSLIIDCEWRIFNFKNAIDVGSEGYWQVFAFMDYRHPGILCTLLASIINIIFRSLPRTQFHVSLTSHSHDLVPSSVPRQHVRNKGTYFNHFYYHAQLCCCCLVHVLI